MGLRPSKSGLNTRLAVWKSGSSGRSRRPVILLLSASQSGGPGGADDKGTRLVPGVVEGPDEHAAATPAAAETPANRRNDRLPRFTQGRRPNCGTGCAGRYWPVDGRSSGCPAIPLVSAPASAAAVAATSSSRGFRSGRTAVDAPGTTRAHASPSVWFPERPLPTPWRDTVP